MSFPDNGVRSSRRVDPVERLETSAHPPGAGLVGRRQDGNSVYYSIADPTVFALCDAVCNSIGTRLTQHATLADELRGRTRRR